VLFHEDKCLYCGTPLTGELKLIAGSRGTPARFCSPAHRNAWNVKNSRIRSKNRAHGNLRATHKGNFKEHFGFDIECYVLDDESKTAVISQRGMGAALGLGQSGGNRLPRFLASRTVSKTLGDDILEKASNPIVFQGFTSGGLSAPPSEIYGYDVTLLIDICKAVVAAEATGDLLPSQAKVAKQAHVILGASAKAGIKGLVYALAGYDVTKEEIIAAYKQFIRDEAREYEPEFPEQLYEEWYRLYKIPKPQRNRPWKFAHLTNEQVYTPLAKSNGRILELVRIQKLKGNNRRKRLHQFLSEIGVKALRSHLGQLLGIAQVSDVQSQYERYFVRIFGDQLPLFPGQ
jgi:hypothetical protein